MKKPVSTASKDGRSNYSSAPASKPPLPKPLVKRPAISDSDPAAKPKKRSFAEIMARAQANAPARESFGKIQHKTIERTLTMRERKVLKAEEARNLKKAGRQQQSSKYSGTVTPVRGAISRPGQKSGTSSTGKGPKDRTPPVEEKKVKKAALATTGYTGTARPRPGSAAPKPGAAARPGRESERERPRFGGALGRPRRYDEEEELDDFIEYDDDEEDGYGRRHEYDSAEDESDMEAGISDIDEEEQMAEKVARREDIKEMELEKRLKREKEERKRKALAAVKAKTAAR